MKEWRLADFAAAVREERSSRMVIRRLGGRVDARSHARVAGLIADHGLDTSHWLRSPAGRLAPRATTLEQLEAAVRASDGAAGCMRVLGWSVDRTGYRHLERLIAHHSPDVSHWRRRGHGRTSVGRPLVAWLVEDSPIVGRGVLHKRIARHRVVPYVCFGCGNAGEWLGKALVLELDHVNGDRRDYRLSNLRYACPNCHSQTPTFRGRKPAAMAPVSTSP